MELFVVKIVSGINGNSNSEVFLGKGVLKICYKFTDEHTCRCACCLATLLKSHFGMGVLLYIYCIFPEYVSLRTPLEGCFCIKYFLKCIFRKYFSKMDLNSLTGSFIHLKRVYGTVRNIRRFKVLPQYRKG